MYLGRQPTRGAFIKWRDLYAEAEAELGKLDVHVNVRIPVQRLSVANQQMIEISKALSINVHHRHG